MSVRLERGGVGEPLERSESTGVDANARQHEQQAAGAEHHATDDADVQVVEETLARHSVGSEAPPSERDQSDADSDHDDARREVQT